MLHFSPFLQRQTCLKICLYTLISISLLYSSAHWSSDSALITLLKTLSLKSLITYILVNTMCSLDFPAALDEFTAPFPTGFVKLRLYWVSSNFHAYFSQCSLWIPFYISVIINSTDIYWAVLCFFYYTRYWEWNCN